LKNSTLLLLKAMVTLTPASRKTRSSGRGRKSGTTFRFPRGSSVYLIFSLINSLALSPITSSKNSNHIVTIHKSNGQNPDFDPAETVVPFFARAVRPVFRYDTAWIGEGELRLRKSDPVFLLILLILLRVPIESGLCHGQSLAPIRWNSHTFIWLPSARRRLPRPG